MSEKGSTDRINRTLNTAQGEARDLGSPTIEAEHILLALIDTPGTAAGRLLRENGVGRERLMAALHEENRRALAYVGVQGLTDEQQRASRISRTPHWGASAKDALVRTHQVASGQRRGRCDTTDLLVGVLQATIGKVPRALSLAGVDSAGLIAQANVGR